MSDEERPLEEGGTDGAKIWDQRILMEGRTPQCTDLGGEDQVQLQGARARMERDQECDQTAEGQTVGHHATCGFGPFWSSE